MKRYSLLLLCCMLSPVVANAQIQSIANCKVIDKPGSYVLAKNIEAKPKDVQPNGNGVAACILIAADFVTLDLSGYTLFGFGQNEDASGIGTAGARHNVRIHDGKVTNFGVGVFFDGKSNTVERIEAAENGAGVEFLGSGGKLSDNLVRDNPGGGMFVLSAGNKVVGNVTVGNVLGMQVQCPALIVHNTASDTVLTHGVACTQLENSPLP
jgi:parallel beta helix pectate lyase-like protein